MNRVNTNGSDSAVLVRGGARPLAWAALDRAVWSIPAGWRHALAIAAAASLFLLTVPRVNPRDLGGWGLVSALPPTIFIALGALAAGFAVALVRHPSRRLLGTYVVTTAALLHGLGAMAYQYPQYPWAWKHAGVVDYILRHQTVDPTSDTLAAYHNWPGFFGVNALITETGGLGSPLSYAAWAPLFFNLAFIAALYFLYRSFSGDERLIWTSIMLFAIGNWVGQDYLAPQASAYLFYLVALGILLRWFTRQAKHAGRTSQPVGLAGALLLILTATVVSHQITPVMMILATAALAVAGRTRVAWPTVVTACFMLIWLVGFARPFAVEYVPKVVADLQGLSTRLDGGLVDHAQVSFEQRAVSWASRSLTAGMIVMAGLGYLRSLRSHLRWFSALVLIAAPLALIATTSYGDEVLFRAFLFALPMLSLFAGALWFSGSPSGRGSWKIAGLTMIVFALMMGSILAQHGNDQRTAFSADEVAVATYMYDHAPSGSAVIQLDSSYPINFRNYENLTELSLGYFSPEAKERALTDPAGTFASWGKDGGYTTAYVLVTRSQEAAVERLGLLPAQAADTVRRSLLASEEFAVVISNQDGILFELVLEER